MRKSERQYNEALKTYNRTAGQLKRHYDVNPVEYLEGVHTVKGVPQDRTGTAASVLYRC